LPGVLSRNCGLDREFLFAESSKPRYTRGVLAKYAGAVTSASLGVVTDAELNI
jgi:hypothetical protein